MFHLGIRLAGARAGYGFRGTLGKDARRLGTLGHDLLARTQASDLKYKSFLYLSRGLGESMLVFRDTLGWGARRLGI